MISPLLCLNNMILFIYYIVNRTEQYMQTSRHKFTSVINFIFAKWNRKKLTLIILEYDFASAYKQQLVSDPQNEDSDWLVVAVTKICFLVLAYVVLLWLKVACILVMHIFNRYLLIWIQHQFFSHLVFESLHCVKCKNFYKYFKLNSFQTAKSGQNNFDHRYTFFYPCVYAYFVLPDETDTN